MTRWQIPESVLLPTAQGVERREHLFEEPVRAAILAALGAARPLLVRGEPGVGKTELAEAAAVALRRRFLPTVVDSRTEARDLMYTVDSVRRLAEAQLMGAVASFLPPMNPTAASEPNQQDAKASGRTMETWMRDVGQLIGLRVDLSRFITPGPLWWAFDWKSAWDQSKLAESPSAHGEKEWAESGGAAVVLIDEIDKAEADVPNGLLEALGNRQFPVPGRVNAIAQQGATPLVVITTNEERALPDAFLRRCVVLDLELPGRFDRDGRNPVLHDWLVKRGVHHFLGKNPQTSMSVLKRAADLLLVDRHQAVVSQWSPKPGQAEYFDLVRAVVELDPGVHNESQQLKRLEAVSRFVLRKHRSGT